MRAAQGRSQNVKMGHMTSDHSDAKITFFFFLDRNEFFASVIFYQGMGKMGEMCIISYLWDILVMSCHLCRFRKSKLCQCINTSHPQKVHNRRRL